MAMTGGVGGPPTLGLYTRPRARRPAVELVAGQVRELATRLLASSSARLDIEASMTPMARRLASEMGSACCCAEADRLLSW